jgi:hypothetical protein
MLLYLVGHKPLGGIVHPHLVELTTEKGFMMRNGLLSHNLSIVLAEVVVLAGSEVIMKVLLV